MKRPTLQFENWPHWFFQAWPNSAKRWQVLAGYKSIDRATLADIALQNNLFAPIRAESEYEAGVEEGKRQAALKIFKLANINLEQLWAQIERRTDNKTKGT